MNLTPGELYFIGETDILTKKESLYIKIGLVRENYNRTSEARAFEHQTGNPRQLHVAKVVKAHAISEVENIIHKLYAPHRINLRRRFQPRKSSLKKLSRIFSSFGRPRNGRVNSLPRRYSRLRQRYCKGIVNIRGHSCEFLDAPKLSNK
jgi:hypothetical protein